jgi:hypothetical protein
LTQSGHSRFRKSGGSLLATGFWDEDMLLEKIALGAIVGFFIGFFVGAVIWGGSDGNIMGVILGILVAPVGAIGVPIIFKVVKSSRNKEPTSEED